MTENKPDDVNPFSDERLLDDIRRAEKEKRLATTEAQPAAAGLDHGTAAAAFPAIEGYEILREIHRGGQGVVYQAVQKSTKRKVAIKVLLEGPFASKSARRRFEREIELVAQLKHPNIIGIFHSGQTSDGRQYYVMGYVRGVPLDQYVHENKLTLEDALKLFATVCEAVNYAHQKGVIHRDLKPSNILVDSDGVPKVLDFGLAKQLVSREVSVVSLTGQVVGTLPYMSPEQAEGNPDKIDIRTDVYALGVILYQILTGHYPYPVAGQMADVLKHIAETPPTPPSRSWKSESGVTQRTHKRIRPDKCPIDDEVQTIVMRTLAKERERRYQSAGELAKDVSHYLADEPIDAKRDSAFYVIRKQLRRYKLPVAVAAAFIVVITVSLVVSVSLWRQAERDRAAAVLAEQQQSRAREEAEGARAETQKRADELKTVTEFQQSMLSDINAHVMGRAIINDLHKRIRDYLEAEQTPPQKIKADLASFDELTRKINTTDAALTLIDKQVLSRAVKMIERDFANHPLVRAALQQTIASTYREIGRYQQAMPLQKAALETRRAELGDAHPNTLTSISNLGHLLELMGKYHKAESYLHEALEGRRRVLGNNSPITMHSMNDMGGLLWAMGKLTKAKPYFREALDSRRRVLGDNHPDTLRSINNMGDLLKSMGKYAEAEPYFRESLAGFRRVLGDKHPDTLTSINNMGLLLVSIGKYADAEPYLRESLEGRRRVLGDNHPDTLKSLNYMGQLLKLMGKLVAAQGYFSKAIKGRRRVLGDDNPNTLKSMNNLAEVYEMQGRLDDALPLRRKVLDYEIPHTKRPEATPRELNEAALTLLTTKVEALRDPVAALPIAQRAVEKSGGKNAGILDTLALAYFLTGDAAKAIKTEEKALSLLSSADSLLRRELEKSLARFRRAAASQPVTTQPTASQPTTQPVVGENQSSVTTESDRKDRKRR